MASVVSYTGLAVQVLEFEEGASPGNFADGDLVETDSSGQIVIATAGDIVGIARDGYTGTQGTKIPVELINPNELYVMTSGGTTNQNQVGLMVDITYTAGAHTVGTTAGSADEVTIMQLHPADGAVASGRVIVRFNMDKIEERG